MSISDVPGARTDLGELEDRLLGTSPADDLLHADAARRERVLLPRQRSSLGMAERMGGSWVESTDVRCDPGAIVVVVVTAETPMFGMPGSMHVEARATAPAEAGPGVAP